MAEMPQLASSTYLSSAVDMQEIFAHNMVAAPPLERGLGARRPAAAAAIANRIDLHDQPHGGILVANVTRRLVQVFIADPDENVPLADCLLHKGDPMLTDLTDQELFFEVDIKTILDQHNQKRIKLVNKVVKERTEMLEPARVRDLKMTVVTIAQF